METEPIIKNERTYRDGVLDVEAPSPVICFYAVWAVLYGYFALKLDHDPEGCLADENSDAILMQPSATSRDVGEIFRICYQGFFVLTFLQLKIALLSHCTKSEICRQFFFLLVLLTSYTFIGLWLYLIYIRFSHPGKVCSGDFL